MDFTHVKASGISAIALFMEWGKQKPHQHRGEWGHGEHILNPEDAFKKP